MARMCINCISIVIQLLVRGSLTGHCSLAAVSHAVCMLHHMQLHMAYTLPILKWAQQQSSDESPLRF